MTSTRQKKAGFELPEPVLGWPLMDVCLKIPDAPEYRRAFVGHLYKLGLWASWHKTYLPGDTRAKDAGELWRDVLNEYLDMGCNDMSCCCNDPPPLYRFNAAGQLEQSTDSGVTWTPAPAFDPRNNSPQFPPMSGADGDDKKCIAATGAALLMEEQVAEQLTDDMARYTLEELFRDWTGTVINSGGNIFQALLTIATNQVFALGIAALRAALTSTVWDTMKCIIYCNMADDASFNQGNIQAITTDIGAQIGGIATLFLQQLVNLLGVVGMTNLARSGAATTGDCDDCDCDITCDLDLWSIATHEGNDIGTETGRGANWIELQTENVPGFGGALFAMIRTGGAMECCTYTGYQVMSGGALLADLFVACGNPPWPGTEVSGGGLPANTNTIRVSSATTSIVRIYFD